MFPDRQVILAPVETEDRPEQLVSLVSRDQEDWMAGKDLLDLPDFRALLDLKVSQMLLVLGYCCAEVFLRYFNVSVFLSSESQWCNMYVFQVVA